MPEITGGTGIFSSSTFSLPLIGSFPAVSVVHCHGWLYDAALVLPAVAFLVYLAVNAKKNVSRLSNGGSYVVISYYILLWVASFLNLAWSWFQGWQCSSGREFSWNILSLLTEAGMLCLEISLAAFLLQESNESGLEALVQTFRISGMVVGIDTLLKAIYVFGFGVPLFIDVAGSAQQAKWVLWTIHKLLLASLYVFILFIRFSKGGEKLPPRPALYRYIVVMFTVAAISSLACGFAAASAVFGIWLYNLTVMGYHSLYLLYLYVTFLADFFQAEDFLLENIYHSEMKDAGFFDDDIDW